MIVHDALAVPVLLRGVVSWTSLEPVTVLFGLMSRYPSSVVVSRTRLECVGDTIDTAGEAVGATDIEDPVFVVLLE